MVEELIAQSRGMQQVLRLAALYAPSPSPILLTGETGTGKTVLARWIHDKSPRAKAAYESRNCAGLSETLALSELFGHQKGAFTGASQSRKGAFRKATGGTLFLDEISRLYPVVQGAILKSVDEGTIQPVGSDSTELVDVRLIAATNQDLWSMSEDGRFAFDLLQRLAVLTIEVPPLRERPDDVLPLAYKFLNSSRSRNNRFALADEATATLQSYPFPGNLRELAAIMEECRLLAGSSIREMKNEIVVSNTILLDVITRRSKRSRNQNEASHSIHDAEKKVRLKELSGALERNSWKITKVAAELGVSRQTISKWIREFDLHPRER